KELEKERLELAEIRAGILELLRERNQAVAIAATTTLIPSAQNMNQSIQMPASQEVAELVAARDSMLELLRKREGELGANITKISEKISEELDYPIRAVAWHTVSKLEASSNFSYADLNGATPEEREENFKKVTRAVWDDFAVHGFARFDATTGQWAIERRSDLDGNSCLKLMELAGMQVDMSKVNFVAPGKTAEKGFIMDTSEKDGVTADKDGARVIADHHGKESGRNTSATKLVYETLVSLGLLDKTQQAYLGRYVDFVTKNDNLDFGAEEKEVYGNYYENLYGLSNKMKVEDVLELIKQNVDPKASLSADYLKNHTYINPNNGKEEALSQFVKFFKDQMSYGEREIEKLGKDGFVLDTGTRFGKVLIDTMKKADKDRWYNRVNGEGSSRQLAVFEKGYGGYVVWSPQENKFYVFTKNIMDDKTIPGGFSQGKNIRGHMLISGSMSTETVKPEFLQEILSKLSGDTNFKIEGKLKKAIDVDGGSKALLNLLDKNMFTEDILRETARNLGIPPKKLLDDMFGQRIGLKKALNAKLGKEPKGVKVSTSTNIRLAMEVMMGYQQSTASTLSAISPQQPPAPSQQPPVAPQQPPSMPQAPPAISQQPPAPSALPDLAQEKQARMTDSLKVLENSFANMELSHATIKEEAAKSQVSPMELAMEFIQGNAKLRDEFEEKVSVIPDADINEKRVEDLALVRILEDQFLKAEGMVEESDVAINRRDQEILAAQDDVEKERLEEEKAEFIRERARVEERINLILSDIEAINESTPIVS
ncbi:MAG: hypothetical protein WC823_07305, partial [Parcubacteria group bacterium]